MVGLPYYIWSNPSGIDLHDFIVVAFYFFEARCKIGMKSLGKFNWLSFISHQPHFCAQIHSLIQTYTRKILNVGLSLRVKT